MRWKKIGEMVVGFGLAVVVSVGGVKWYSAYQGRVAGTVSTEVVKLVFGGDVMWDRYIRQVAERKGDDYVIGELDPILLSADLVVVNLEGPITDNPSVSRNSQIGTPENYVFTFDRSVVDTLVKHNIGVVNLGNNHIFNFGVNGVEETKAYLKDGGVSYFGDVRGNLIAKSGIYQIGGIEVGMVGYNQFSGDESVEVETEIAKIKSKVDLVVIYAHWGQEYNRVASRSQVAMARDWVDSGADVVIGSHPHVVQGSEIYKGKPIYYSLGNLVFDQYFDEETMKGMLVEVEYQKKTGKMVVSERAVRLGLDGRSELEPEAI